MTSDQGRQASLIDLCGRLILTHRIPPATIAGGIDIDIEDAVAIAAGTYLRRLNADQAERLMLVVNILLRLEMRLGHDSRVIRVILEEPLDTLGGATPAKQLCGSLEDLRRLRCAIDRVEAPREKWWRVGH